MRIGTFLITHCRICLHCIRLSGWMRIGTELYSRFMEGNKKLHPAFGLDEDWNDRGLIVVAELIGLHPAFGLDEDWNQHSVTDARHLDEVIASGFRAG